MGKVILSGYIGVPEEELDLVMDALATHSKLTKQELGCLVFQVTQDAAKPTRFEVYEEFVDMASFQFHQQRVQSSQWGGVSKNVTRHYQIKEVE